MSRAFEFVIPVLVLYVSLVLHELGHCLFPRLAGFNYFNGVIIGVGRTIISFRLFGMHFKINIIPIPIGRFFSTKIPNDVEMFRNIMKDQTRMQIFLTHAGGNLVHLMLWISSWTLLSLSNFNWNSSGLTYSILNWVKLINGYVLIGNLIPIYIYNRIDEFSGNDIVQLVRRLNLSRKQINRSMQG